MLFFFFFFLKKKKEILCWLIALRNAHRLCDLSTLAGVEVFCFVVPQTKNF